MAKKKPTPEHDAPDLCDYSTTAEPKAWADEIPVFCAHDAIVKTSDLKPNPKNPNQHPPEQVKLLGAIIRGQGCTSTNASDAVPRMHQYKCERCGATLDPDKHQIIELAATQQQYAFRKEESGFGRPANSKASRYRGKQCCI